MTKRNLLMYVSAVLAIALFTFGCGGDDDGLSAEDMARIQAIEDRAAAAEMAAEEADMKADAAADAAAGAGTTAPADDPNAKDDVQPDDDQVGLAVAVRVEHSVNGTVNPPTYDVEPKHSVKNDVMASDVTHSDIGDPLEIGFQITQQGNARMTSPDDMAEDAAPTLSGWKGVALESDGPGITQTALVYTDIQVPVTAFSSRFQYNRTVTNALGSTHFFVGELGYAPLADGNVKMVHALSTGVRNRTLKSDLVTATAPAVPTMAVSPDDTTSFIRGTYAGIEGQYRCVGTCDLTWTSSGGVGITRGAEEPGYLVYGTWLLAPDAPTTGNAGFVRVFSNGNAPAFDSYDIAELNGSATYKGNAVGHYSTRDARAITASEGRFTADATLTADFDAKDDYKLGDLRFMYEIPQIVNDSGVVTTPYSLNVVPMGLEDANEEDVAVTYSPENAGPYNVFLAPPASVPTIPAVSLAGKIDNFMDADGNMMDGWIVNLLMAHYIDNTTFDKINIDTLISTGFLQNDGMTEVDTSWDELNQYLSGDPAFDPGENSAFLQHLAASLRAREDFLAGDQLNGYTTGIAQSMEWTGVWDGKFRGLNTETLPVGVHGAFHASAGTPLPVTTPEGVIKNLEDLGFAGVVGAFGARR